MSHRKRALAKKRHTLRASDLHEVSVEDLRASVLEAEEQRRVWRLCGQLGVEVVSFSQPRATMQTIGIPDLKLYIPRKGATAWLECKRPVGGVQSDAQQHFQAMAEECGETYLLGGYEEVMGWLRTVGVIVT